MKSLPITTCTALAFWAVCGACAAATFDPTSGTGQVSARDVQTLLGWTDAQFQERAPAVTFNFRTSGQYTAICSWTNAQGARGEDRRTVGANWQAPVNSLLRQDPRNPKRIDGFQLAGFGPSPYPAEAVPITGAPCLGLGGLPGTWSAVVPQLLSPALSASFGGVEVRLPF